MTPQLALALLLTVAVLGAWLRLMLWRRAAPVAQRGRPWRIAALMLLQPLYAALLFFGLFPPDRPAPAAAVMVATAEAPTALNAGSARLYALPEAPTIAGAERAPDLGTILRRHPGVRRITVVGQGLTARDRDALGGVAVDFRPSAAPRGIVALDGPARVAPGAAFMAGGQADGYPGGKVDLLDPAGRLTDSAVLDEAGLFRLEGTARAAGLTAFTVRLTDRAGREVERALLPVRVEGSPQPRLLILAAAPGAEVKYLRRWATDAGFDVTTQINLGDGVQVGDPPVSMDATTLARFDAVVADERSWSGLGAGRGAVLAAVRGGLGLVLRPSGPLDGGAASEWRALGFSLGGAGGLSDLALPKPRPEAIQRSRLGIPSADEPLDAGFAEDVTPDVQRLGLVPAGAEVAPLLQDANGVAIAAWRAMGRGRAAVFTPIDSYALSLTGRGDLYAEWWSALLSTVIRPGPVAAPGAGPIWRGERTVVCGLKPGARVVDGPSLRVDQRGCAAYWPASAGWGALDDGAGAVVPVFVQASGALPAMRARQVRDAMLTAPRAAVGETPRAQRAPGASWPWLAAWFVCAVLLWWLERSRSGRARLAAVGTPREP